MCQILCVNTSMVKLFVCVNKILNILFKIRPRSASYAVPHFGYRSHLFRLLISQDLGYWLEVLGDCISWGSLCVSISQLALFLYSLYSISISLFLFGLFLLCWAASIWEDVEGKGKFIFLTPTLPNESHKMVFFNKRVFLMNI